MNPKKLQQEKFYNFKRQTTFGIRKWTIGVVSVSLGTALLATAPAVAADAVEESPVLTTAEQGEAVVAPGVDTTALKAALVSLKASMVGLNHSELVDEANLVVTETDVLLGLDNSTEEQVTHQLDRVNAFIARIDAVVMEASSETVPTKGETDMVASELTHKASAEYTPATDEAVLSGQTAADARVAVGLPNGYVLDAQSDETGAYSVDLQGVRDKSVLTITVTTKDGQQLTEQVTVGLNAALPRPTNEGMAMSSATTSFRAVTPATPEADVLAKLPKTAVLVAETELEGQAFGESENYERSFPHEGKMVVQLYRDAASNKYYFFTKLTNYSHYIKDGITAYRGLAYSIPSDSGDYKLEHAGRTTAVDNFRFVHTNATNYDGQKIVNYAISESRTQSVAKPGDLLTLFSFTSTKTPDQVVTEIKTTPTLMIRQPYYDRGIVVVFGANKPLSPVVTDASKYTPKGKDISVPVGSKPPASDGIDNKGELPPGTTYDWVKDPDTSTPGDKPSEILVTYPDKSTDVVPITVKVGKDADKHTPQAKPNTVKVGEDPKPSDSIVTGPLPGGTTYDWKPGEKPDTSTPGDKPGKVVVNYPDGSKDEVPVTVTVVPAPRGKDLSVPVGAKPPASDGIDNKGELPPGTTYSWVKDPDTSTPGDKPSEVLVTYPDGSKDTVKINVKVGTDADKHTPIGKDQEVLVGQPAKPEDSIDNKGTLPPGTTYTWKTPVDTSTPGDKPATVVVTYPDKSTDEVPVKVIVKQPPVTTPDKDKYTPRGKDLSVPVGAKPPASDGIDNKGELPLGTTYSWVKDPDTSTPGNKPSEVLVTYPDKSTEVVPINVKVGTDADLYRPRPQDGEVDRFTNLNAADYVANKNDLPPGTRFEFEGGAPVTDTNIAGRGRRNDIRVIYPDNSVDVVTATITVRRTMAQQFTPSGKRPTVSVGGTLQPSDLIGNSAALPSGTTYTWVRRPNLATPGPKLAVVRVNYPDGSSDQVTILFGVA